jgi:hypothetical protein
VLLAAAGECYQEDILFGGLPDNSLDTLVLPDLHLLPSALGSRPISGKTKADIAAPNAGPGTGAGPGAAAASGSNKPPTVAATSSALQTSTFKLTLMNNSSSKHFKFKWPDHPQLKFSPSAGHLHAGGVKNVTVTFASAVPLKLDRQEIKLAVSQITYKVFVLSIACSSLSVPEVPGSPSEVLDRCCEYCCESL